MLRISPPVLIAVLAVAIAASALGVTIATLDRRRVLDEALRSGKYLVSTADGQVEVTDLSIVDAATVASRRSIRVDTINATTSGRFAVNLTVSLVRQGLQRVLYAWQPLPMSSPVSGSTDTTVVLDLPEHGVLDVSIDLPDASLFTHSLVSDAATYLNSPNYQYDLMGSFNVTSGVATLTNAGPDTSIEPWVTVSDALTPLVTLNNLFLKNVQWQWQVASS